MYVFQAFQTQFFSGEQSAFSLQIGILTSVALLTTVVFQVLFGFLSDRAQPRYLLSAGMLILGLAALLIVGLSGFSLLLLAVVLLRVGSSFYHPVGISWISKLYKGGPVDKAMGFQSAFGDAGVIIAFVTSPILALQFGWAGPFLLWGVASLAASLLGWAITRSVEYRPNPLTAPPLSHLPHQIRGIGRWILPLAIGGASYNITNSFGPLLLARDLHFSPIIADGIIALWLLVGVVAAYLYGHISARAGRFNSLRFAFLIIGISGLLLFMIPLPLVVVPTFIAFGAGLFITYPALFAFVSEGTEVGGQGLTFGLVFAFQLLGGAVVAYPSGLLAAAFGFGSPFLLMAALGLVTFGFLTATARSTLLRIPRVMPSPTTGGAGPASEPWEGR